jgi:hypothetical protein
MPSDEFWTELCDSLTAFYNNILKKSGAGGRLAAKHLSSKFVTQTASVPDPPVVPSDDANTNAVEPPAYAAVASPAPPPASAAEAAAPRKTGAAYAPAYKGRGGNQIGGRAGSG